MKKGVKIVVFIIAALVIMVVFASIKQSLHNAGQPAAVNWIGMGIIVVLYYIMFGNFGKSKKSDDKSDDIQLKK